MIDNRFLEFCQNRFILTFALLGPFSVTQWDKLNAIILIVFSLALTVSLFFTKQKIPANRNLLLLLSGYFAFVIVGMISSIISLPFLPGAYVEHILFGRFIMCLFCFLMLIHLHLWLIRQKKADQARYFLSLALFVLICFMFIGVWQWLSFFTSIPFPFETRSYIHGVSDELKGALGSRTTSLAREPNYLAPLLFECVILSFVLLKGKIKKLVIYITLFVALTTLSGGVYAHFIILSLFYFFQSLYKFKTRTLIITASLALLILFLTIPLMSNTLLGQYVVNKFTTESQGGSLRGLIVLELFNIYIHGDITQLLLGYGLSSLEFSDAFYGEGRFTDVVFSISNITYLDVLFQSGIIGFILYGLPCLITFVFLWKRRKYNKLYEAALMFLTSLLISGIYRSEYATSHFAWSVGIVIILIKLAQDESYKQVK